MDFEEKYNKLVEAVKVLQKTNPSDEGIQNWVNDNVPELKEGEDERIRKALYLFVEAYGAHSQYATQEDMLAWLEKKRYSEFELENEYWRGYDDSKKKGDRV